MLNLTYFSYYKKRNKDREIQAADKRREEPMATQLEIVKNRLFQNEGLKASNIKMFPGSSREVSPEQIAEQINRALTEIEEGGFEVIPESEV